MLVQAISNPDMVWRGLGCWFSRALSLNFLDASPRVELHRTNPHPSASPAPGWSTPSVSKEPELVSKPATMLAWHHFHPSPCPHTRFPLRLPVSMIASLMQLQLDIPVPNSFVRFSSNLVSLRPECRAIEVVLATAGRPAMIATGGRAGSLAGQPPLDRMTYSKQKIESTGCL